MSDPLIVHARPQRQPNVDAAVYHYSFKNSERQLLTLMVFLRTLRYLCAKGI
jgi:hypothetical protein